MVITLRLASPLHHHNLFWEELKTSCMAPQTLRSFCLVSSQLLSNVPLPVADFALCIFTVINLNCKYSYILSHMTSSRKSLILYGIVYIRFSDKYLLMKWVMINLWDIGKLFHTNVFLPRRSLRGNWWQPCAFFFVRHMYFDEHSSNVSQNKNRLGAFKISTENSFWLFFLVW